jgi:LmbE family N-acetylglucosaminyl deacetylase
VQFIERYRPEVVVTYEPSSTRHPDHVHTARVATYAVDAAQVVARLYDKAQAAAIGGCSTGH